MSGHRDSYGGEDMEWHKPDDDSVMQDMIFRALTSVKPCFICSRDVGEKEGWHRDGKAWCPDHQPAWSRP